MLKLKVIYETVYHPDQFISPIFTRPKKDGEFRMILNLKELNKYVKYFHFKMDTFEIALKLVKQNSFMAVVDQRHAYYSVPIASEHRKYLRFRWKGKIYEFSCLPNGLACAPRYFTKLTKPIYAKLRQMGHTNSGYIDDSLLIADSEVECVQNVEDTVSVMTGVGFIIHSEKSGFKPSQDVGFLGKRINSKEMIVYLPEETKMKIKKECMCLQNQNMASIRVVARVVGLLVSTFSAVEFGPLHYRVLEKHKIDALKSAKGNFDAPMTISDDMKSELQWWVYNLPNQIRKISHGNPNLVIVTDASLSGWGAHCGNQKIGGRWAHEELNNHINFLELLAIFLGLKSFCRNCTENSHVQVKTDNTTAKSYINAMGGIKSPECNMLAKKIWQWCIDRNIWLSAAYTPGSENPADFESRNYKENTEWKIDENVLKEVFTIWGKPNIDLFASRLNKQIDRYASWHPDPEAEIIDAFSCDWSELYFYAFPPFSLIPRFLAKLRQGGECILITPVWTTQNWFPSLMELMIDTPRLLPKGKNLLHLPGTQKVHPLCDKMVLMACRLSGEPLKTETYQRGLPTSSWRLGDLEQKSNTRPTLKSGFHTVIKGKLITFKQI